MKYMGSKRSFLKAGLDMLLLQEVQGADRFVDLFCGTGRVSWFVAEAAPVPVLATDLQEYASLLAGAIVCRNYPVAFPQISSLWLTPAYDSLLDTETYLLATSDSPNFDSVTVERARQLCAGVPGGPIWRCYGGYYFSPLQAAIFDHLIQHLPQNDRALSSLCRASLVLAASKCAAAPGHTAQPFQPSASALPYIRSSWSRDPLALIRSALEDIAPRHAHIEGQTLVADANYVAEKLCDGDVVFVDPPYSNVQYSRFYHVLETIARGDCGPVSGVGRYPPRSERPRSEYSMKSQSRMAISDLLWRLADRGCRVVLTFPHGDASNGLNGEELIEIARDWFSIDVCIVDSHFSTLGGNGYNRRARHRTEELLLTMRPH